MSEFEQLIEKDFGSLTENQFKNMLKLIWSETGKDRILYYNVVQCKIMAENYKLLKQIKENTRS